MSDARTDAFSIYKANETDKAKLVEVVASIESLITADLVSGAFKNTNLSGDPKAGSVRVSRFQSSTVRDYGTARGNDFTGDKVSDNYVTVNLDTDKEIVEELNGFDVEQYGIANMLGGRVESIASSFSVYADEKFFELAESVATAHSATGDTIVAKLESLIQKAETVKNRNVHGVKRNRLAISVTPEVFGALENHIDTLPNPVNGGVDVNYFHRVRIYPNVNQEVDAIIMLVGSIAQPIVITDIRDDMIPMSNEHAVSFFFRYGVKAVTPDLIFKSAIVNESIPSA